VKSHKNKLTSGQVLPPKPSMSAKLPELGYS